MFEMLPQSEGKIVGVRATGKLTDADYAALMPFLEERIAEHKQIRMLVDLDGFEGWDLLAAWDDFTFGMTHWHHFEKMAIVGNKNWEKTAAKAMDLLMRSDVRFFDLGERDAAWDWIKAK